MIYAYIRVSTDRQSTENQRFEILKFASERRLPIDTWIEETISATKPLSERQLGALLARLQPDDLLIVTELSRLGRSLLEVMSILHAFMDVEATVFTTKDGYALGNTINAKVLAFAFALSAEIERAMISSRTKEALARKKSEGQRLGRPKGSLAKVTKLTGKEQAIRELLEKRVSYAAVARIFGVNRGTVTSFVRRHGLNGQDRATRSSWEIGHAGHSEGRQERRRAGNRRHGLSTARHPARHQPLGVAPPAGAQ